MDFSSAKRRSNIKMEIVKDDIPRLQFYDSMRRGDALVMMDTVLFMNE